MSKPAGFDYQALLIKYMRHVLDCEGITFMGNTPQSDSSAGLSGPEWIELERIAKIARDR